MRGLRFSSSSSSLLLLSFICKRWYACACRSLESTPGPLGAGAPSSVRDWRSGRAASDAPKRSGIWSTPTDQAAPERGLVGGHACGGGSSRSCDPGDIRRGDHKLASLAGRPALAGSAGSASDRGAPRTGSALDRGAARTRSASAPVRCGWMLRRLLSVGRGTPPVCAPMQSSPGASAQPETVRYRGVRAFGEVSARSRSNVRWPLDASAMTFWASSPTGADRRGQVPTFLAVPCPPLARHLIEWRTHRL